MEFNQKLQVLRKEKGITQEQLAKELFVSRTAVSKWELGRGYPNLESLKDIAKFFDISIDQLLSGNELLTAAEEDNKRKQNGFRNLLFALFDISVFMFLILPFFAQKIDGKIYEVSLLGLTKISVYLKVLYMVFVIANIFWGVLLLVLQSFGVAGYIKSKYIISLLLNAVLLILFIVSLQPYAAILTFVFLSIKSILFIKWK